MGGKRGIAGVLGESSQLGYVVNKHGDRFHPHINIGFWDPFQMAELTPWRLFQWGLFLSTYIQVLGWSPKCIPTNWTNGYQGMDEPAGIYISPAFTEEGSSSWIHGLPCGEPPKISPSHSHRWRCDVSELPKMGYIVDGSEISGSPGIFMGIGYFHDFQGFIHPGWCRISSSNSMFYRSLGSR